MLCRLRQLKLTRAKACWGTWAWLLLHCSSPVISWGHESPEIFPIPATIAPLSAVKDRTYSLDEPGSLQTISYPDAYSPATSGRITEPRPAAGNEYRVASAVPGPTAAVLPATPSPAMNGGNGMQPQMMMLQPSFAPGSLPPGTQFMLVPVQVPGPVANAAPQMFQLPAESNPSIQSTPVSAAPSYPNYPVAPPVSLRPEQVQGLSQQVGNLAGQGFQLAERSALFAARQKFEEALQLAAQGLDGMTGRNDHGRALANAQTAFKEAEDFAPRGNGPLMSHSVAQLVELHRTAILKNAAPNMPPVAALQAYYRYGRQETVQAVGLVPAAADALHGLGKVHSFLAREESESTELHVARAIACQQAALDINPKHARAANELGVLLAKHGQWQEAKSALVHSLRVQPRAETWHNLVVVHQRLGENDLAQRAQWEMARMNGGSVESPAVSNDGVQWVEPEQFARQSPHPNAPLPGNVPGYVPRVEPGPTASRPYGPANHYR